MPTRAEFLLLAEHWCELVDAEATELRAQLALVTAEKDAVIVACQREKDRAIAERDEARLALSQALRQPSAVPPPVTRPCARCPNVFQLPDKHSTATLCPACRSQQARKNITNLHPAALDATDGPKETP